MFRVYTQLTTNIPDNSSALKLLSLHNFYELYWILTNNIFKTYGMSSLMAEAELTKLLMIQVLFDGMLPSKTELLGFYQVGVKKVAIVDNEIVRYNNASNDVSRVTGNDRHVRRFCSYFNPYKQDKVDDLLYTKIVCQESPEWVKWNLNEIIGEIMQSLRSKVERKHTFGLQVLISFLLSSTGYENLVMALVTEKQWGNIQNAINGEEVWI